MKDRGAVINGEDPGDYTSGRVVDQLKFMDGL